MFSLPDKDGKYVDHQGLLDTRNTHGLILTKLVERHGLETEEDNGCWSTDTGRFNTSKKAVVQNMKLPNFTRKRIIKTSIFSINLNANQKCKAIFGLDFLVANGIDFINNSGERIKWDRSSILMYNKLYVNRVKI